MTDIFCNLLKASFAKKNFFILFFISICAYSSILQSNYFFADDAYRVFTYTKIDQGGHGRPLADIFYYILSAGTFMDMSPLSQILAIMLLIGSAFLTIKIFNNHTDDNKLFFSYILPLLFITFPLHHTIISYRFDSFSMAMAIYLPTAAFYINNTYNNKYSLPVSTLLLMLSAAFYQPMYPIYLVIFFIYIPHTILSKNFSNTLIIKNIKCIIYSAILYIPVFIYAKYFADKSFFMFTEHPHTAMHSQLISIRHFFDDIFTNMTNYIQTCYSYINLDILSILSVFIILCTLAIILFSPLSCMEKILSLICMLLAFISCGAIQLVLKNPIFAARTLEPLSSYIFMLFIFTYIHKKKLSNTFLACITILSCVTSTGILIAFGNAQRDQGYLENIALLEPLSEDLGDLLKNDKKITIYLEEHIPLHPSYRKLKEKFNYIEISTIAKHVRLSSCFNIYLTPDMDTSNAAIIKSRLAYTIYKCANQQYMIKMNADYTPDKNTLIK